jgi:hypothetical protein
LYVGLGTASRSFDQTIQLSSRLELLTDQSLD